MSQRSDEGELLRGYLLGDLDEARREQVEERLLRDDDFAARLSEAQDALIDDYVFDALPADERASFDKNFIIDEERRQKLLFARALEVYVEAQDEPRPAGGEETRRPTPWWGSAWQFIQAHKVWSGVAAAALVLLVLGPFILRQLRPPDQLALKRERRAQNERLVAEVNKRPADPSTQALPAFSLSLQQTILREDGGLKRADLTGDHRLLTLRLGLTQARHQSYRALVSSVEGEELFAADGLTPEADAGGAAVRLNLPVEVLAAGDYQIQLWGRGTDGELAEIGRYSFRVARKN